MRKTFGRESLGDIIGVHVAGSTRYFITSAPVSGSSLFFVGTQSLSCVSRTQAIQAVYRNAKAFVFTPTRLEFTVTMFDASHEATYAGWLEGDGFALHHTVLAPVNIGGMVETLAAHWNKALKAAPEGKSSLEEFVHQRVYGSVSATLFGEVFPADKVHSASSRRAPQLMYVSGRHTRLSWHTMTAFIFSLPVFLARSSARPMGLSCR